MLKHNHIHDNKFNRSDLKLRVALRSNKLDLDELFIKDGAPVSDWSNKNDLDGSIISKRILDLMLSHRESVLFSGDGSELSGVSSYEKTQKIIEVLTKLTPKGGRVAVIFPPSTTQCLAILAVIASQRVPVILNHWTKPEDLEEMVLTKGFHGILGAPENLQGQVYSSPIVELDDAGSIIKVNERSALANFILPDSSTLFILFTSGSMGNPKAVQISKQSILYISSTIGEMLDLNQSTVATITLPLFHTMGLNSQFFPTFFAGGKIVITNTELSAGKIFRNIKSTEGTIVTLISDMLRFCKNEMDRRNLEPAEKVKSLQLSAGHINKSHVEMAKELFPNATIFKGYGLTETMRVCMISSEDPNFLDEGVGYPLNGLDLKIRDENLNSVDNGITGEIFVKGPGVTIGYEGQQTPRLGSDGYFATGDFGYLSNHGVLVLKGRKDHVFKSNGRKIASMEIEKIARDSEHVLKAKCIPVPCRQKGLKPVLFLEVKNSVEFLDDQKWKNEVESTLKNGLDAYKTPRDIFITQIPLLPNRKINERAVKELWEEKTNHVNIGKASFGLHFFNIDKNELN